MPTRAKAGKSAQPNGRGAARLLATSHDLPEETRRQMVALLNAHLADLFDLYSQAKQAHWNVKGQEFFQLHELYDTLAEQLLPHIDMVAERATALGGVATGTARMAAAATRLPEFAAGPVGSLPSVRLLAERYAAVAQTAREAIDQAEEAGDMGTSDLFIEVSRDLDKALWFLEAHVQASE